jgi:hypothetical protein
MLLFLLGVVLLFGISLLAVGVGKAIALGNDYDAPQHVNRSDWERVVKPLRRS